MSDSEENDSEELAPFDELEGAFVTLKHLAVPTEKLVADFKAKQEMRDAIGMQHKFPDAKRLKYVMVDEGLLRVWEILRNGKSNGYVFFVTYDGPPFIAIYLASGLDVDVGKDIFELLLPVFFKNTEESALFYYHNKPVPPEVHDGLIEGGFDEWEDNPTIDNTILACYVLERYTFDAYYNDRKEFEGEDEDDYGGGEINDDDE